jgi:hypothetical protein
MTFLKTLKANTIIYYYTGIIVNWPTLPQELRPYDLQRASTGAHLDSVHDDY